MKTIKEQSLEIVLDHLNITELGEEIKNISTYSGDVVVGEVEREAGVSPNQWNEFGYVTMKWNGDKYELDADPSLHLSKCIMISKVLKLYSIPEPLEILSPINKKPFINKEETKQMCLEHLGLDGDVELAQVPLNTEYPQDVILLCSRGVLESYAVGRYVVSFNEDGERENSHYVVSFDPNEEGFGEFADGEVLITNAFIVK